MYCVLSFTSLLQCYNSLLQSGVPHSFCIISEATQGIAATQFGRGLDGYYRGFTGNYDGVTVVGVLQLLRR